MVNFKLTKISWKHKCKMLNYSVKDAWYSFPEMTDYIFIFNVKSFKFAFLFDSDFLTYNNEYSF